MCSLSEMLQRVDDVRDSIVQLAADAMEGENSQALTDLNIEQLYDDGIDSLGHALPPYKQKDYAEYKYKLRDKAITDLRLTGEFQQRMYLIVVGDEYGFDSTDGKRDKLVRKYGEQIFGLTDENKPKAFAIIRPKLVENVNEILKCEIV